MFAQQATKTSTYVYFKEGRNWRDMRDFTSIYQNIQTNDNVGQTSLEEQTNTASGSKCYGIRQ